jgi:PAS domain S-box-containing protein
MIGTHFKVIVFTPTKLLFKYLSKNLMDHNLEFFYASSFAEVEQYIHRIKPRLLITHIDEKSEKYLSTLQIMQSISPVQDLWYLLLLGENFSIDKVHSSLPNKRTFLQYQSADYQQIVYNILTIRDIEDTLYRQISKNRYEENINSSLRIIYQEKDINLAFERLVNFFPKILRMDFWCIFTLDRQLRHLEHFAQFTPPTYPKNIGPVHAFEQIIEEWLGEGIPFLRTHKDDPAIFERLGKWGWPVTQIYFLPIHLKGRTIGGILIGNIKDLKLDNPEVRFLNEVARSISQRIQDEKLSRTEIREVSDFSDQLITNHFDESSIFQHACKRLNEINYASSTIFWQYNKGFGFLFPKYYYFLDSDKTGGPPEKNVIFLTKENFLSQLIELGEVRLIENIELEDRLDSSTIKIFKKLNYSQILILPLEIHNEVTGALIINKRREHEKFSILEIHKAEEVVKRTQNVIEDAQTVKEANFKLKQLSRIFELGNEIKLDTTLHNILSSIIQNLRKTLGWNDIAILLEDERANKLRIITKLGFKEEIELEFDFNKPVNAKKFRTFLKTCSGLGNSYFYNSHAQNGASARGELSSPAATEWQKNDLLIIPLETRNKTLGYMLVHDPVDRLKPTVEKIVPLEYYGNQAAIAAENSVLYEKLRTSEERYRSLAETMSLGLVTCDKRGRIVYANPAFRQLLEYDYPEVTLRELLDFFLDNSKEALKEVFQQLLESTKDRDTRLENLEFEIISKSGEKIPVSVYGFPLYEQREKTGFFLVLNDLRVIKHMEQMKADFNSMIVHDLRSPMNVIQGFMELIRNRVVGEINSEQEELLDIAKENVKKVLALVDNFLVASRLEIGKFSIEPKLNEINNLVLQQVETHRLLVKSKNININLELNRNLPPLYFDSLRIEQVLNNLLSNAMKFTPENGDVYVSSGLTVRKTEDEERQFVRISVKDTGTGIPEDQIEYIFEKYEQASSNQNFNIRGTGLGLSICKEIVTLHGGEIWVESEPGKGSTFSFSLPIEAEFEVKQDKLIGK